MLGLQPKAIHSNGLFLVICKILQVEDLSDNQYSRLKMLGYTYQCKNSNHFKKTLSHTLNTEDFKGNELQKSRET